MQDVGQMLKDMNLDVTKIQEIAAAAQGNPFAALSKMQELGISMETLQKLMGAVMANPQAFLDMATQAGVPSETLDSVKDQLKRFT
ncbi:MAG: DUF2999 family protein [Proteobacteria bacterium]|nr:MAG: DUF2999 family protein [Pseudomonadota bacterium]